MRSPGQSAYQPALAVVLASLIAALPLMAQAPAGHPAAGQITALIPAVQRNDRSVKVKEEIDWQDVLRTDRAGRARLSLRDGSIVSLGSYSELKVIQHDPNGQETLLQLSFGKVRSRVVAINRPDGRFEVQTPSAVLNVLGTDFFTQYDPSTNDLRVICYSGTVKVSGLGRFEGKNEIIHAGQMLEVTSSAFGAPQATLNAVQQDSIAETTLEGGAVTADSHLLRNVLIGAAAAAAGIVVGLVEGGSTFSGPASSTASSPTSSGAKRPQP